MLKAINTNFEPQKNSDAHVENSLGCLALRRTWMLLLLTTLQTVVTKQEGVLNVFVRNCLRLKHQGLETNCSYHLFPNRDLNLQWKWQPQLYLKKEPHISMRWRKMEQSPIQAGSGGGGFLLGPAGWHQAGRDEVLIKVDEQSLTVG